MNSTNNNMKYRFAYFQDNVFKICRKDFLLSENNAIGQYITSNWFKQEIIIGEPIILFVICYTHDNELKNILSSELVYDYQVLGYSYDSPNIIGTFLLDPQNINYDLIRTELPISHEMRNFHNSQNEIKLHISIVKNKHNKLFIYGPNFEIK